MTNNPNRQPDISETAENAPIKPTFADCLPSLTGPGAPNPNEKVALQFPPDICLKIGEFLNEDADDIATAEDHVVSQYYQVVNMFLEYMLDKKTKEESDRVQFHYLRITRRHLTLQLQTYSKRKRPQKRTNKSLYGIFSRWETELGISNGFEFLKAIQSTAPTNNVTGSHKQTAIGGMSAITEKTPIVSTPPIAQPAIQTPVPQYGNVKSTTGTSLYLPVMLGPTPTQPNSDSQVALQAGFGTTVEEPANVETGPIRQEAMLAATTPPESTAPGDNWDRILAPADEQLDQNTQLYNNPEITTIIRVYNHVRPASPEDWQATIKDLEKAMVTSFEALGKNLAALDTLSEADKEEIYKIMVNAISKTGNSKFRKRFIHEVHTLAKNKGGKHQREVIDTFNKALSNQYEYDNPRELSGLMNIICRQPSASEPNPKDITPKALSRGYDELDKSEIDEMPAELQGPLHELLEISREFGLAPFVIATGAETITRGAGINIEQMDSGKFRLMCAQIFQKLQSIEDQTRAQFWHASTWRKKSPTGKVREFTKKLRQILSAQFVIMEELMFSKELFIPEQIRTATKKR